MGFIQNFYFKIKFHVFGACHKILRWNVWFCTWIRKIWIVFLATDQRRFISRACQCLVFWWIGVLNCHGLKYVHDIVRTDPKQQKCHQTRSKIAKQRRWPAHKIFLYLINCQILQFSMVFDAILIQIELWSLIFSSTWNPRLTTVRTLDAKVTNAKIT